MPLAAIDATGLLSVRRTLVIFAKHMLPDRSKTMTVEAKPPLRAQRPTKTLVICAVAVAAAVALPVAVLSMKSLPLLLGSRTQPAHVYAAPGLPAVSSDFQVRLEVANSIGDGDSRDEALRVLASSLSLNSREAKLALSRIQNPSVKNAAAWDAAKRFSAHAPQDGLAVIEGVLDGEVRDIALQAIATGTWPERPVRADAVAQSDENASPPENANSSGYATVEVREAVAAE